jgi:hypothetical protein
MATITKYQKFLLTQMNGGQDTTGSSTAGAARVIDFDTDTLKVALVTASYSPSVSGHAAFNSITNEVTGTNYSAGGSTLAGISVTESGGTTTFVCSDVTWAQSGTGFSTARYAIIYKSTGTAATSTLIGYIDLGGNKGNVDGDLTLDFGASVFTWA